MGLSFSFLFAWKVRCAWWSHCKSFYWLWYTPFPCKTTRQRKYLFVLRTNTLLVFDTMCTTMFHLYNLKRKRYSDIMPISVPTLFALRFVKNNSLQTRIHVLQTSYKTQIVSFFSVALFQLREHFIYHDIHYLMNHLFLLW